MERPRRCDKQASTRAAGESGGRKILPPAEGPTPGIEHAANRRCRKQGARSAGPARLSAVATAQVSNMILARGVAGSVPPFSIAFFRWSIVALGLLPRRGGACGKTRRVAGARARHRCWPVSSACSFAADRSMSPALRPRRSTLSLIMALRRWWCCCFRLDRGEKAILVARSSACCSAGRRGLIITRGQSTPRFRRRDRDLLVLMAMLGWAGYTLLQTRVSSGVSFLARIGLFAAAARCSRCPSPSRNLVRAIAAFSGRAALVYLFAGLVPAFLPIRPMPISARSSARCRRRSALSGPIVSAVLSILFLGEAPTVIHLIGGALSLGGMWLSLQAKQGASSP